MMSAGDLPPLEAAARPLQLLRLRRAGGLGSLSARCFVLGDPIDEAEAREVLGDGALDEALRGGLVLRTGDHQLVSPWELSTFDEMFVLGDPISRGGDAVMSWGQGTVALMRATWRPDAPRLASALDLGCGGGTCALALAERTGRVLGCDINERAVALSRVNAVMNDVGNVEFRAGDLCAPVSGERFDLVVSQPPFIPRHEGAGEATYLWGGTRGDELPLRALSEAAGCLAVGGRAMFYVQWPVFDDEPIEARVRRAVPDDDVNVLVLPAPTVDIDANCVGEASMEDPSLGAEYARALADGRKHLDDMGLVDFRQSIVVLERRKADKGWTGGTAIGRLNEGRFTGTHVESLLAAHELASRGEEALLQARLRLPQGTGFVREGDGEVRAVFPRGSLLKEAALHGQAHRVATALHESASVREAARRLAKQHKAPLEAMLEDVVRAARGMLRAGILARAPKG